VLDVHRPRRLGWRQAPRPRSAPKCHQGACRPTGALRIRPVSGSARNRVIVTCARRRALDRARPVIRQGQLRASIAAYGGDKVCDSTWGG
jgi:hypothetical protein